MGLHREFACCYEGCMAIICLTPEQESMFRRTHHDFRCPMGHVQGFYEDNEQEKKIKKLEQEVSSLQWRLDLRDSIIADLRAELRSARARIGAKTRKLRSVA